MITNETIIKQYGGLNANSLSNMLFTDRENDEPELIRTSNYFDNANLSIEMSTKMHSFNILKMPSKLIRILRITFCLVHMTPIVKVVHCNTLRICTIISEIH